MERWEFRERLAGRPSGVRFDEVERLLHLYGWTSDRSKGSHFVFRKGPDKLVIPFRRPHVLAVYVRLVLKRTAEEDHE